MSVDVEQLHRLHSRYTGLSHRFRAAWAFHQYLGSLFKLFMEGARLELPVDFQEVYGELKSVSRHLNAAEAERVQTELASVEARLGRLSTVLAEEDSKVSPHQLRRFFQRVKKQDPNILVQLIKFYAYQHERDPWPRDRLDKVDFLLTTLSQEREATGLYVVEDPRRVREVATGLWQHLSGAVTEQISPDRAKDELAALRREIAAAETLDAVNDQRIVSRYRELKHGLGSHLFRPELLAAVLETNLSLKNLIRSLSALEERRIVADYQRIFELEREVEVDRQLDEELASFRQDIEQFEDRLGREELKLDDLARIRERIQSLEQRLTPTEPGAGSDLGTAPGTAPGVVAGRREEIEELVGDQRRRLNEALDAVASEPNPKRASLSPEIFPLRLEPREVQAHRRLFDATGTHGDREVESLILDGAALRLAVREDAESIRALLDDTAVASEAPVIGRGRRLARLAGAFRARYQGERDRALLDGRHEDARQLLLLEMRLTRDWANLWLLAEKARVG